MRYSLTFDRVESDPAALAAGIIAAIVVGVLVCIAVGLFFVWRARSKNDLPQQTTTYIIPNQFQQAQQQQQMGPSGKVQAWGATQPAPQQQAPPTVPV